MDWKSLPALRKACSKISAKFQRLIFSFSLLASASAKLIHIMNHYESSQDLVFEQQDVNSCETQLFLSSRQMSLDCLRFLHLLKSALFSHLSQFHIALASPCLHPFPSFLISSFILAHFPAPSLPTLLLPLQSKTKFLFYSFQNLIIFCDLGF